MSLVVAASTMFRIMNFLMAFSLGMQWEKLVEQTGCTWPWPFLAWPLFLLFLVIFEARTWESEKIMVYPLNYASTTLSLPLYYCSFVISFETGKSTSYKLLNLLEDCFEYSVSMSFHININLSVSAKKKKNSSWDFERDWVEHIDQFVEYCHLNNSAFWSTNMGCFSIYVDIL